MAHAERSAPDLHARQTHSAQAGRGNDNEPNDDRATSTPTGLDADGERYEALAVGLDGRTGVADDWYQLEVPPGCELVAEVRYEPRHGQVDVRLWSAAGVVASAGTGLSPGLVRELNASAGPLQRWLQVVPRAPVCTRYDIDAVLACF